MESGLMAPFVVAIDGPAGSGTSSVSRAAAEHLGFSYLDTGAAYRAVSWFVLEHNIPADNPEAVVASLDNFSYDIGTDPQHYFVTVNDVDVTEDIRLPRISATVSTVAKIPEVRTYLGNLFRTIITSTTRPGIIAEGRDITTRVAPEAPVRILLTASEEARLARRSAELPSQQEDSTATALKARDAADSRVSDFLTAAEGVITVDSTEMNFEETVNTVVELIEQGMRQKANES